ncbi:hypothetical protein HY626_01525 [Candidatus Uhrbacteria bacterium]|nr:hypothetical protein [Candidatus Uhrbacteria bacterium]
MTIAVAKNRVKMSCTKNRVMRSAEDDAWSAICGMWEKKRIDPVAYQRKIRKEADHVRV